VFASFIFYGATTLGVFVLRIKMPEAPRPYKAWGYPVIPAIFIIFCIVLIAITFITKPREAFLGAGLMLTGLPFWFYWNKQK
jgi:APA family basic amino acid/polyamine antiporter